MRIAVVGSGYVGLVTGVCLADIGHEVACVDLDKGKIERLNDGQSPIYEPGIEDLIVKNLKRKKLSFTTNLLEAMDQASIIFVAVGTPPNEDGSADLQHVMKLATTIGKTIEKDMIVVVKSTVPVGSCEEVERLIQAELTKRNASHKVIVASNPEFLKEGTAIADFMKPDRIVVGLKDRVGEDAFKRLYHAFIIDDPSRLMIVDRRSSELIKYTANAMLATRISFMNEISQLCEKLRVNVDHVRLGIGADPRIGKKFLYAGPGYGGSCFPKDVSALIKMGQQQDLPLDILTAVEVVNKRQIDSLSRKIIAHFKNLKNIRIGVWGLAFKPGTDDVREAPSKALIQALLAGGAQVVGHDPKATQRFAEEFPKHPGLKLTEDLTEAVNGMDAVVLMTEWREYRLMDWERLGPQMKQKVMFDFRNQYDADAMMQIGFHYVCVGRPDSTQKGAV